MKNIQLQCNTIYVIAICNLYSYVTTRTPVVFHNCSNYEYHFIIKELPNKFTGQYKCLGENTEKHVFLFQLKKKSEKLTKMVRGYYNNFIENKLIDSTRFIVSLLSNLVNNLAKGINKFKCKDYNCFLEYESINDNYVVIL